MPRIQGVTAGPARSVRATPRDFGQGAQPGLMQAQSVREAGILAVHMGEATMDARRNNAVAKASEEFAILQTEIANDPDFEGNVELFKAESDKILGRHREGLGGRWAVEYDNETVTMQARSELSVSQKAREKQIDFIKGQNVEAIKRHSDVAAATEDLDVRERELAKIDRIIDNGVQNGVYTHEQAEELKITERRKVLLADADQAIIEARAQADFETALEQVIEELNDLDSPTFGGLSASDRAVLEKRARSAIREEKRLRLAEEREVRERAEFERKELQRVKSQEAEMLMLTDEGLTVDWVRLNAEALGTNLGYYMKIAQEGGHHQPVKVRQEAEYNRLAALHSVDKARFEEEVLATNADKVGGANYARLRGMLLEDHGMSAEGVGSLEDQITEMFEEYHVRTEDETFLRRKVREEMQDFVRTNEGNQPDVIQRQKLLDAVFMRHTRRTQGFFGLGVGPDIGNTTEVLRDEGVIISGPEGFRPERPSGLGAPAFITGPGPGPNTPTVNRIPGVPETHVDRAIDELVRNRQDITVQNIQAEYFRQKGTQGVPTHLQSEIIEQLVKDGKTVNDENIRGTYQRARDAGVVE